MAARVNGRNAAFLMVAILSAAGLALWLFGPADLLNPDAILARRDRLREMADGHRLLAVTAFVATYIVATSFTLPVAAALSLLGGFLFGAWLGAAAVLVGATAGALLVFLVARSAVGAVLRERAGPLYAKVADNMRENAFAYLLFMRLVPLFPFFLVNLVAALVDIRVRTFVIATALGIAPATFLYVSLGRELGRVSSVGELLSPTLIGALTGLGLIALAPVLYRQWRRGRRLPAE
jgi:uncharacterized membrane protein YdjX (TVP38/TMEM64 family)